MSAALADCFCDGRSWRHCRDQLMNAYPVGKLSRRERFAEVMAGVKDYSAEQLDGELIDLYATSLALGGQAKGTQAFLEELRLKASIS